MRIYIYDLRPNGDVGINSYEVEQESGDMYLIDLHSKNVEFGEGYVAHQVSGMVMKKQASTTLLGAKRALIGKINAYVGDTIKSLEKMQVAQKELRS